MAVLRSALFALVFYAGSVAYVLTGVALIPLGRKPVRAVARGWARFHRRCCAWILGIHTRIEGEIPPGAILFASKHQSMFETTDLVVILDTPRIVMKQELAYIPLWGLLTRRYGMIVVDRAGGATALRQMVKEGEDARAEGRPIVIFPEGTRVPPGERPALQAGFAGLYRALGLPVVPVALDSGQVYPPRRFTKRAGIVTFRFGEPIPPGLKRGEIEARVYEAINSLESGAS
jgi:1-acyl-sn-glycerol-3-phosphate acyltransferase